MMKTRIFVLCITFIALISACTNVREAAFKPILDAPEDAHPAPVIFKRAKVTLPIGAEIGVERMDCLISFREIGRKYLQNAMDQKSLRDSFTDMLELQGYDVVSASSVSFEEEMEDEIARAEYSVNAKIISADMDVCGRNAWLLNLKALPFPFNILDTPLFGGKTYKGRMFLKVKWGLYDNLRRTTVYQAVSEGYVDRSVSNIEGLSLMLAEAFEMAAHNLGTDQDFHDLLFYGKKPPQTWRKKKKSESRPRKFSVHENVIIHNSSLSKTPFTQHVNTTRKSAVLIQSAAGHGSGFFITKQGHILTNAHVVGDALRVRVVTAGKKEKLIAEVLRKNKARDVALLKLETIPENLDITTAAIRKSWPKVSEEIYALGAPSHTRMQDTLTKGIISAHRKNFRVFGIQMDFLQSDVQIIGGNSGGPIFDAYGNIVGMSAASLYQYQSESNSGLNLFVPINSALRTLNIDVAGTENTSISPIKIHEK